MPSGKKPTKKKSGAKSVRSVPTSDMTPQEREKKVVFRGQTITYEEQLTLEDLEKEAHKNIGNYENHEAKDYDFAYKADNGKVTKLEIRDVGIKRVPESIKNLKSLVDLTLSYNKLTTLPESIGDLKSVAEILLHGNQLIALPDSMGGLESLRRLWLQDNKLTELPNSLLILPKLKDLEIKNNPLNKASIKIWEQVMKQTGRMEDINATEKAALEDLEKIIGEPIPRVDQNFRDFGYLAE
ncbi:MAG: leucine-rich repeat domain-containing protein, partial [Candidatus Helarchaeota archaeon]|nr:leucine-rich repeat domain-containing protein [Candidatus Helarchaeota archaeon]